MRQDRIDPGAWQDAQCRYRGSRTLFRGPPRVLAPPYIACLGGSQTFGRYIDHPFPALLEPLLGRTCVNLGSMHAGITTFADDSAILDICHRADLTIVQVMGANNLSNRFYTVHPRRNDRFLRASDPLQTLYPEVDFTEFTFTRHLLGHLHDVSPVRFEIIVHELRQAWVARMQYLLAQIGGRRILLWFSAEPLNDAVWSDRLAGMQVDPLFVTAGMIDRLRSAVRRVVVVNPSPAALAQGCAGLRVPLSEQAIAAQMFGPRCHAEAAAVLVQAMKGR